MELILRKASALRKYKPNGMTTSKSAGSIESPFSHGYRSFLGNGEAPDFMFQTTDVGLSHFGSASR